MFSFHCARQNTIVVGDMVLGNAMEEMNDEDENLELFHSTKNVLCSPYTPLGIALILGFGF